MISSLSSDLLNMLHTLAERMVLPDIADIIVPPKSNNLAGDFGMVVLRDQSVGFFYVLLNDTLEQVKTALTGADQDRISVLDLGEGILTNDLGTRALALGAVNAASQHLLARSNWSPSDSNSMGQFGFDEQDHVGMVGLFPSLAPRLAKRGIKFTVIERQVEFLQSDYHVSLSPGDLTHCNKVLITASTLLNDSLEEMLSYCTNAEVAVIGPTAGCLPDPLFARGVDVVGGSRVLDMNSLPNLLRCGQPWTDSVSKYAITRAQYPGLDQLVRQAEKAS